MVWHTFYKYKFDRILSNIHAYTHFIRKGIFLFLFFLFSFSPSVSLSPSWSRKGVSMSSFSFDFRAKAFLPLICMHNEESVNNFQGVWFGNSFIWLVSSVSNLVCGCVCVWEQLSRANYNSILQSSALPNNHFSYSWNLQRLVYLTAPFHLLPWSTWA